jgi:hypothetical protein
MFSAMETTTKPPTPQQQEAAREGEDDQAAYYDSRVRAVFAAMRRISAAAWDECCDVEREAFIAPFERLVAEGLTP